MKTCAPADGSGAGIVYEKACRLYFPSVFGPSAVTIMGPLIVKYRPSPLHQVPSMTSARAVAIGPMIEPATITARIAKRPGMAKSLSASTMGVALREAPLRGILGGL